MAIKATEIETGAGQEIQSFLSQANKARKETEKNVRMSIYLPESTVSILTQLARQSGIARNDLIRKLTDEALEQPKYKEALNLIHKLQEIQK